jgi:hypothetical protein
MDSSDQQIPLRQIRKRRPTACGQANPVLVATGILYPDMPHGPRTDDSNAWIIVCHGPGAGDIAPGHVVHERLLGDQDFPPLAVELVLEMQPARSGARYLAVMTTGLVKRTNLVQQGGAGTKEVGIRDFAVKGNLNVRRALGKPQGLTFPYTTANNNEQAKRHGCPVGHPPQECKERERNRTHLDTLSLNARHPYSKSEV